MKTYGTIIDTNKLEIKKDIDMILDRNGSNFTIAYDNKTLTISVDDVKKTLSEDERPFWISWKENKQWVKPQENLQVAAMGFAKIVIFTHNADLPLI